MEQTHSKPLLWEVWLHRLMALARENRLPLLSGLIFGGLAHMYILTNKLINNDEVFTLFGKGGTYNLGRWGLELMHAIFPDYSMPWIYGVFTIVSVTISAAIIVRVLQIKNPLLQVLLAGSVVCFPTLTATLTYMYTTSSYALSFLLSVLSVWLLERDPKGRFLPAAVCLALSVSIYQAYVALAAGLLLLLLIRRLLLGEQVREVIFRGLWFLGGLIAALAIYYAGVLFTNQFLDLQFSEYADRNLHYTLGEIPGRILKSYTNFFRIFLSPSLYRLIPTDLSLALHWGLLLLTLALLGILWAARKDRSVGGFLLLSALTLLLPMAINCMHLFANDNAIHTLVLYSFVIFYFLALTLGDLCLSQGIGTRPLPKLVLHGLTALISLILVLNIYMSNEAYLSLHLRYETAYGFFSSVYTELTAQPDFHKHTRLALMGSYQEPNFYYRHFNFIYEMMGVEGFRPEDDAWDRLMEYYFGHYLSPASPEERNAIAASPEFAEMPVYPSGGSMKMIGDVMVVKLSP